MIKTALLKFLLFSLSWLFASLACAQPIERYKSYSYNVNEGLLQSNVLDLDFDRHNFCWISFANGIQKFDGRNFHDVKIQPGLPDNKWTTIFSSSEGDLFIAHAQGVSRYDIDSNRFQLLYRRDGANLQSPFLGQEGSKLYVLFAYEVLIEIDAKDHSVRELLRVDDGVVGPRTELSVRSANNVIGGKTVLLKNKRLQLLDLKSRRVLKESHEVQGIVLFFMSLSSQHEVYYHRMVGGRILFCNYDFFSAKERIIMSRPGDAVASFRSQIFKWGSKMLFSFYNRLYELDSSLAVLKRECVNFKNAPIADESVIAKMKSDRFGNLYIVTINSGFRKVMHANYPIKYFGTDKKSDNYVISIYADKARNRVLTGTYGSGLFIFDTLQQLIKHIKYLPGKSKSFAANTIVGNPDGSYIFYGWSQDNGWKLSADLTNIEPVKVYNRLDDDEVSINYFASPVYQDERHAVIISYDRIFRIDKTRPSIVQYHKLPQSCMGGTLVDGSLVIHARDELLFIDTSNAGVTKRASLPNTGQVRCFTKDDEHLYIGCNKGIFKAHKDGKILKHFGKEDGLPDECIYAMTLDVEGNLWCSSNKGIFRLNKAGNVLLLAKEDGLQENEFNTNAISVAADGEIFWGGVNGATSFHPSQISATDGPVNVLFTCIKVNNKNAQEEKSAWNITALHLDHDQNALSFDFLASAGSNPDQYIYQYKMIGVDEDWMRNNGMETVHYYLAPGKYRLGIYASRMFDPKAVPTKEIEIIIYPPFWKTWWFMALLGLSLTTCLAFLINYYNKRKYRRKLLELRTDRKVQSERERISRDLHDNIGAYANTVLYKTDLLQKDALPGERAQLLHDLKFASKDIITSLRETIWALKKPTYTAQQCLLRITNFVQPFIGYYPHIDFKVVGTAPENLELHYSKALNLVRIMQEAVSNALKHAEPSHITIQSEPGEKGWAITVSDDGRGFNFAAMSELEQGNGITNMQERARDSGFTLDISSSPGNGTSIRIFV